MKGAAHGSSLTKRQALMKKQEVGQLLKRLELCR